jgi:hypothetical protein
MEKIMQAVEFDTSVENGVLPKTSKSL